MVEASGLEARVLQHEIDHLDGVLMLDRTEPDQRKEALRALREGTSYSPGRERRGRRTAGRGIRPGVRTVFLGTSEFAVAVLGALAAGEHRPVLVVTPPDRPRGRGRRTAAAAGGPSRSRAGDRAAADRETSTTPRRSERIIAAGPRGRRRLRLRPADPRAAARELELLNVHPSLLPRWRGAAPIERAIMAGDAETGVTIIRVGAAPRLRPDRAPGGGCPIGSDDYGSLVAAARPARRRADLAGARPARRGRGSSSPSRTRRRATYAEKIAPTERRLDPGRTAIELERIVRALDPHLGAYLELEGGERLGVLAAEAERRRARAGPAGGDGLRLGCAEGALRLLGAARPAAGAMDADAYLRGHPAPRLGVSGGDRPTARRLRGPAARLRARRLDRSCLPAAAGPIWRGATSPRPSGSPTAPCSAAGPPTI